MHGNHRKATAAPYAKSIIARKGWHRPHWNIAHVQLIAKVTIDGVFLVAEGPPMTQVSTKAQNTQEVWQSSLKPTLQTFASVTISLLSSAGSNTKQGCYSLLNRGPFSATPAGMAQSQLAIRNVKKNAIPSIQCIPGDKKVPCSYRRKQDPLLLFPLPS